MTVAIFVKALGYSSESVETQWRNGRAQDFYQEVWKKVVLVGGYSCDPKMVFI